MGSSQKIISLVICLSSGVLAACATTSPEKNDLKFSNTQVWIPEFRLMADERLKTAGKDPIIALPPPPETSAKNPVLKKEIDGLLLFQRIRGPELLQQIFIDRELSGWVMGEFVFNDQMYGLTPVGRSLDKLFWGILPDIMAEKKTFDRVRGFRMDARVKPSLEVPGHPSYPSGHSSDAFFLAHFLADVAPDQKDAIFCDAARLAVEREVAGLHYPSDTAAGELWADAYYKKWKAIPENAKGVEQLKTWWSGHREKFLAERAYRKPKIIGLSSCNIEQIREYFLRAEK